MRDERVRPFGPRLIFGLFIIALGVLFTLDNLDILEAGRVLGYWPVILIFIGLVKMVWPAARLDFGIGGLLVVIGTWILLNNTGLLDLSFGDFWPLLLVLLGVWIIYRSVAGRAERTISDDSGSSIRSFAVMGGVERKNGSQDFRGGELTAIMGGVEIDLRQASISSGPAVLDVFAMWGGIEIRVPEDWRVTGKVTPIMGAFEDTARPPAGGGTKELVIKGLVLMGGVEVKN